VLRRQREKLEAELALHEGQEVELAKAIEGIAEEIEVLTGSGGHTAKKRSTRKA
jgi:hypothetical protein